MPCSDQRVDVAFEDAVRLYDDGPDAPAKDIEKEKTFRLNFTDEARRIVRDWTNPSLCCQPQDESRVMFELRRRMRDHCSVWPLDAGVHAGHMGYRPSHAVAAARLRGRHHAMEYVIQFWDENDVDSFETKPLELWLRAVERWARASIAPDRIVPPPRPFATVGPQREVHAE